MAVERERSHELVESMVGAASSHVLGSLLSGERFPNNEEVESAVSVYSKDLDGSHYKQGIEAIEHHWKKCMKLKEDCVEK